MCVFLRNKDDRVLPETFTNNYLSSLSINPNFANVLVPGLQAILHFIE